MEEACIGRLEVHGHDSKSNGFSPKRKANNNQSSECVFKDLTDSKDKCECKNENFFRLGSHKGSSLNKDLDHLCFWSSSLKAWTGRILCYVCMLSNAKNTAKS